MAEPRYRIGTLARLSGVSTHLIRVWERRYEALEPDRSGGGARLYSPADLERLRLLKRAVDRGHAIGQVARLATDELEQLSGNGSDAKLGEEARAFIDDFVDAVRRFDGARAEELLVRASLVFSARSLALEVLGPLLGRVGTDWARGDLCIASEHVASALVRDSLSALLRQLPKAPNAELAVVATPEGESHELGALLAAVTIALHGYRVLYLGASLPDSEIVRAAREAKAAMVALSAVSLAPERAARAIRGVASALPNGVDLVLGGTTSELVGDELDRARIVVPGSLSELDHWLEARRTK